MIRLHHSPQTRSMRTLWLLHELDVPFEVLTYPFDATLQRPEYLAMSPVGRVPALEIDGEVMFETGAIAEYLCERFSPDGLGRAPGSTERMEWLTWVHFAETLSVHVAALTQQHVMLFQDEMRSPVIMKLEAKRLAKCYAAVEAKLTKGFAERYILQGGFSAADIGLGQAIYMGTHFAALDDYPAVAEWYARMVARPAFIASLPAPGQGIYDQAFYDWRAWQ
ncbi:glutathione S-transferase family protein [Tropicimonas sp. S265A]|uniref:glutathione S-transferase family protein n=1 Tax=Tropicimonas sp. S265A TaxID=3415134 RepID=UPI003C7AA6D4